MILKVQVDRLRTRRRVLWFDSTLANVQLFCRRNAQVRASWIEFRAEFVRQI
jgi:hypothetical protein